MTKNIKKYTVDEPLLYKLKFFYDLKDVHAGSRTQNYWLKSQMLFHFSNRERQLADTVHSNNHFAT